ncbi:MAG: beta-ketoacyl-[acyl-carrier-protein] synthase II, partial [Candidatus Eremiobacteraeota bacterium]|nr:beta-ketoacyl-[acyl-carrier-protein] synthase II [Candidatus Eremiobacteraeota bacterium]
MTAGAPYRVVVTGIGIVSPIGIGVRPFWENTLAGKVGVGRLTRFDPRDFNSHVAAQIDDFDVSEHLEHKLYRRTDRYAQFTLVASKQALDDAKFEIGDGGDDVGVWIGSALAGLAFAESQHDSYREHGARAVRPLLAISVFGGAATANVALAFGVRGANVANANSCAA